MRPWLCPTSGPSPGQPGGLDCFERKPLGGGDPSSQCRWEGQSAHPGTVSQVFPLDSRPSRVKDRAGPAGPTGCFRKAWPRGCSHCPGMAGGNEPLPDHTPGPQPVAVLAEHISASAICDWKSSPCPSQNRPQHVFYCIWVWTLGTGKSL